jgi:hypothetical protein|tara:strand:+ start:2158 stop:2454 length:297 start_codon:yes stop_codon:yes gene_type:complete
MSRNLSAPYFPNAPKSYNQAYLAEIVRAFSLYVQQVQNPGEGRNTFSVFTNLQTDDSSLELGAIFNHEGYVKIAEISTPHLRGSAGTGQVGAVTVVIG